MDSLRIGEAKRLISVHRPVVVLIAIVFVLTFIPVLDTYLVLGNSWQGIPPAFGDEPFYPAHVQAVVKGYTDGNPYFFEHRNDQPLVVFGGVWINAIPQLLGLSYNTALLVNFIIWSLLFALTLYWLFKELLVPPWLAVFGTICTYLQMYSHTWRPVNMQPVYPFYFLFYVALARLMREQSKVNIILLSLATGSAFYLNAYFWQIALITLGLLFLFAFAKKDFQLLKATFVAGLCGVAIGLPVLLHSLWLSRTSPYFWESIDRFGLVNTHFPMAEVFYSGGWVGFVIVFLGVIYWRAHALRQNKEFIFIASFLTINGLGLWVMQGSNIITGKLLETAEHLRILILPWLIFFTVCTGALLWRHRTEFSKSMRVFVVAILVILSVANVYYTYHYFSPFLTYKADQEQWKLQQLYAKPFAWLQNEETSPVVVWSNPHNYITPNIPNFTRHFTLYAWGGMMTLMSNEEVRERYLVSEYFDNPSIDNLKESDNMGLYLGRSDYPHKAKSLEREIKICRLLFFWDNKKDCGTPQTPAELLGDPFFKKMHDKFTGDIKPNIKAYLKKYNVSYILKDKMLDKHYRPEALGAVLVYSDERFEIYHL